MGDPMRTFDVWYRTAEDGRAPEHAFLDVDYTWAGETKARNLRDLHMKLDRLDDDDPDLENQRPLRAGDVVRENSGPYWIFTPQGVWASVHAFDGPIEP